MDTVVDSPLNWALEPSKAYPPLQGVEGTFKQCPEDFIVEELPNYQCSGEGEHLYLFVEKRDTNTLWLIKQLARYLELPASHVGYAGLKDRTAVTRQWLSVYWGLKRHTPNYTAFEQATGARVLQENRHEKKLRRGQLYGNRFQILIKDVQGSHSEIDKRLKQISTQGVPNYFGPQRFGFEGQNLTQAQKMFQTRKKPFSREKASLYLSSARSYLFNWVLSQRVQHGSWQLPLLGEFYGDNDVCSREALNLSGCTQNDTVLDVDNRLALTGPLWGRGSLSTSDQVLEIEQTLSQSFPLLCDGLEHSGLSQERRLLTSKLGDIKWHWIDGDIALKFSLAAGSYATVVLRELGDIRKPTYSG